MDNNEKDTISKEELQECTRKLMLSRLRILNENGFFGLLLMHCKFSLEMSLDTAATDGSRIIFSPAFLKRLTDSETAFVLKHEVMHIVLNHCERYDEDRNHELWNIASDIVVNSNIMMSDPLGERAISIDGIGVSMHVAPNGKEGYEHTTEEIYEMLQRNSKSISLGTQWDDHSLFGKDGEGEDEGTKLYNKQMWQGHLMRAAEAEKKRMENMGVKSCGNIPILAERLIQELKETKVDWRSVLNDFVQEEITDYSFNPPDRRYQGDFFLPDYNEKDECLKKILFMIDTSGSMSKDDITTVFSEVKGAIDMYDGHLEGWLGFFDAEIVPPIPFTNVEELLEIVPKGGGGTSFEIIFSYIQNHMQDDPPVSIIILTDGIAPYPQEEVAGDIPVLWVLTTKSIEPPWGRSIYLED